MKKCFFISLFFIALFSTEQVTFSQELDNRLRVVISDKIWTIKFNTNISEDSLTNDSIFILDEKENIIPHIKLDYDNDSYELRVKNKHPYSVGQYSLHITNEVESVDGNPLRQTYSFPFKVSYQSYTVKAEEAMIHSSDSLDPIGTLKKGTQITPIDVNNKLITVRIGSQKGLIIKDKLESHSQILELLEEDAIGSFLTTNHAYVYDSKSQDKKVIARLVPGKTYDYSSKNVKWFDIQIAGKQGYVLKSSAVGEFIPEEKQWFKITNEKIAIFQENMNNQVGELYEGETFLKISSNMDVKVPYHKVLIGGSEGIIPVDGTSPIMREVQKEKKKVPSKVVVEIREKTAKIFGQDKEEVIATMTKGQHFKIISYQDGWYGIDFSGTAAYLHEREVSSNLLNIPLVSQYPELPSGCEVTALAMALQYYGESVNKKNLADSMIYDNVPIKRAANRVILQWGDPDVGYVGNPYALGITINPKPLKKLADHYRPSVALHGENFNVIKNYVKQGNPTLVWFTLNYEMPMQRTWNTPEQKEVFAPRPLHCIVITGIDENYVYFNDSDAGKKNVKVSKDQFIKVYNAMGKRALVIK